MLSDDNNALVNLYLKWKEIVHNSRLVKNSLVKMTYNLVSIASSCHGDDISTLDRQSFLTKKSQIIFVRMIFLSSAIFRYDIDLYKT